MNKTLYTAMLIFLGQSVIAQKGIDNLIKAEKDFAAYSVAHSTKEAFLQYIDSNSIMFDEGKPVTAHAFWNKREKRPGILNWHPQYAEISASGDFGYTTGPWTFRMPGSDSVIARGQYATVWELDKKGQWKFLIDFGIDNTQPGGTEERIIDAPKIFVSHHNGLIPSIDSLVAADSNFNSIAEKEPPKAYKEWLSSESIMTRNGFLPAITSAERKILIDSTPLGIQFQMKGNRVSIYPPDMGYTYGTAIIMAKQKIICGYGEGSKRVGGWHWKFYAIKYIYHRKNY